jgi:hypothetical protein
MFAGVIAPHPAPFRLISTIAMNSRSAVGVLMVNGTQRVGD